jgi:hypothetical protein
MHLLTLMDRRFYTTASMMVSSAIEIFPQRRIREIHQPLAESVTYVSGRNELLPMCPEWTAKKWLFRLDSNQQPSGLQEFPQVLCSYLFVSVRIKSPRG